MDIPTYDQFIEPILRFLGEHLDSAPAKRVHEAAATPGQEEPVFAQFSTLQLYNVLCDSRTGWLWQ